MNLYEIDYYDTVKDFVYRRKGNVLITDVRFVRSYDELFDRK